MHLLVDKIDRVIKESERDDNITSKSNKRGNISRLYRT